MVQRISLFILSLVFVTHTYAVTYPTLTPTGEIPGGAFQTYFDNMYTTTQCNTMLQVVAGFSSTGVPICVTPTAAGFSLLGQTLGDTARFNGTDWVRSNLLYNDGTNIGINTQLPTTTLDVNGQIRIRGGSPAIGRILMSDATGVSSWYDPLPSLSGSFWTLGGNTLSSTQNFGTISNHVLPFIVNNLERMRLDTSGNLGIGTATPGARLEVAGQVKITGGGIGSGRFLVSDATGLASWTDIIPATSFSISGSTLGDTLYYNGTDWVRTNNIFHTGSYVGIGTVAPGAKLEVAGQVKITGGGVGSGYVLTSDSTGLASWQLPTVAGINGGQANYIARWLTSTTLGTGTIYDNGTNVGIGTISPGTKLDVVGGDTLLNGLTIGRGGGGSISNTTVGALSFPSNVTGVGNVAIGASSLGSSVGPINSIGIGYSAGSNLISGSNNIALGANTIFSSTSDSNQLNIGNWIYGSGGNIGIGTGIALTARLSVNGQVRITGGSPGSGRILTSDATGLATWTDGFSGSTTASGIIGGTGSENYLSKFGTGGIGLFVSQVFDTGTGVGIGTATPGSRLEVAGQVRITGGSPGSGRILTSDATGLATWATGFSGSVTASGITGGTQNYVSKFGTGGNGLVLSQIFDTGTGIGIGTASPSATLDVDGHIRLRTGSASGLYLVSDATGIANWTSLVTATSLNIGGSVLGSTLYYNGTNWIPSTNIYNSGANIGIGTVTPSEKLTVSGSALITSDLTVQGKIITDTIVNRTVANVSISGSILPDNAAPLIYRNIGSTSQRWNNLFLSGQISIGGGSPAAGRILTSDATGLATWTDGFSGSTTASGIIGGTGSENYLSKFGTGGIGLFVSQVFDTGTGVGIGTATPGSRLEVAGQVRITGGSPGSGRILTSDATGLATWATGFSGSVTASGITGGTQNYVSKFGTGGNGLVLSQIFDTGTGVVIGATTLASKFEVWSGATVMLHMRGTNNLGFGSSTVRTATSGSSNIGFGHNVLRALTTGYSNTAMGVGAAYNNTTGFFNSAYGDSALYSNDVGNWNTAIGTQTLWTNLGGGYNIAIGGQALYSNSINNNSIALGYQALRAATADNNIAIGYMAGSGITTGTNNIVIGSNIGAVSNTASNQLNIGNWIYGSGGNIGIGTGANLTSRLNIDSGTNGVTGLRLPRVNNNSAVFTGAAVGLGIDANGNVVPVSNGDVVVYDALGRNSAAPTPDPDIAGRRIRYDFNKYFQLPTKQSFVVSNGNGAGFNAPYFKEDGISGICSWNGASGTSPYDCAVADPVTGLSASPNNSFTMTARGNNYGYQLALGARGDAPLFARSGRWFGGGTNYGSGLYLADGTTPTPWQKVLTVPANHIEYFYVNIGYNSQLQEIAGGGNIGMGTSNPDMRLVLAYSGTTGSTREMMRIQRGVQGADANMVNTFGTPYLMIGGEEKGTNSIQTIGFGYTDAQSAQPVEIGLVTTNTTGNTQGDLVFATRNATTNTAPSERMRIFSNGNVTIGSTNNSAKLRVDGQIMMVDGTQGVGKVLTSDANGLATWQTPSGGGGGGGNYTSVLTGAASRTSNTLGDLGLNSASLPVGYYSFRSTLRFRTAATTTGLGISMVSNGATVANYGGMFTAQTAANATQTYSNAALGNTTLLSTQVPVANTDYIATYQGVFQVTTAGSVKLQYRSEVNGSNVTIQPGSSLIIEPL